MSVMPKYAMTYIVVWPDELGEGRHVLKVGRAWRFSRVHEMTISGGQVVVLARGTDSTWETEALRILRRWFPQAFTTSLEATRVLFRGRGWTECFEVDDAHLQLAVDLCFEGFAKGSDQGVNEKRAEEDQRRGSAVAGVSARPARGEADSDRVVDDSDRPARAVPAGAGADRRGDLPGRSSDGDGRRSCADARRLRVPHDLPGRARRRVDRAASPARRRCSGRVVERPGAPSRTFAKIRGCGGSGRAGACEGAGRERRAGERVGTLAGRAGARPQTSETSAAAGCSADRMPGSPSRTVRGLRPLRDCAPTARQVHRSGEVHAADDRVRTAGHRAGVG